MPLLFRRLRLFSFSVEIIKISFPGCCVPKPPHASRVVGQTQSLKQSLRLPRLEAVPSDCEEDKAPEAAAQANTASAWGSRQFAEQGGHSSEASEHGETSRASQNPLTE